MNTGYEPEISVIIVAYNRREYVINAIKSVLNQDLPRNFYEIILVKNFSDLEIDTYVLENKIKNVLVNDGIWGESIYAGIKESKGDIIVFLDDDDEFEPKKMSRILEVFRFESDVVYYHNAFDLVSFQGILLKSPLYARQRKTAILTRDDHYEIIKVLRQSLFSNLSSVAMKRDIVLSILNHIKELSSAIDVFVFYMALDSGYKLYFDNEPLSRYYIRKESAMHSISSLDSFLKSGARESNNEFETYKFLLKNIQDSYLLGLINGIGIQWKILLDSISEKNNISEYMRDFLFFLAHGFRLRPRYSIMISLIVLVRFMFRDKAKYIFFILRTRLLLV